MATDKISGMTPAAAADLAGTTTGLEVTTLMSTTPATLSVTTALLRRVLLAGGTGMTATDPITAGAASFTTGAFSSTLVSGGYAIDFSRGTGSAAASRYLAQMETSAILRSYVFGPDVGTYGAWEFYCATSTTPSTARVTITNTLFSVASAASFSSTVAAVSGQFGEVAYAATLGVKGSYATFRNAALADDYVNYAIFQNNDGATYINAAATKSIALQINNATMATIVAAGQLQLTNITATPAGLVDGQLWYDGTNFRCRLGGVTKTVTVA